jgi:hypothetical protein
VTKGSELVLSHGIVGEKQMNHEHIAQLGHSYGISSGQLLLPPCPRGSMYRGRIHGLLFRGIIYLIPTLRINGHGGVQI